MKIINNISKAIIGGFLGFLFGYPEHIGSGVFIGAFSLIVFTMENEHG